MKSIGGIFLFFGCALLFYPSAACGEIFQADILLKYQSLPGNPDFSWVAESEQEKAKKYADENNIHAIQSVNAAIAVTVGYEWEVPMRLVAEYAGKMKIVRYCIEGICPSLDLTANPGVKPKVIFGDWTRTIHDGTDNYQMNRNLEDGYVGEQKFANIRYDKPYFEDVRMNYVNHTKNLLKLLEKVDEKNLTSNTSNCKEYMLYPERPDIRMKIYDNGRLYQVVSGDAEHSNGLIEFIYDNGNDFVPDIYINMGDLILHFNVIAASPGSPDDVTIPKNLKYKEMAEHMKPLFYKK
ncbi:MAG: hypothetical protein AB1656_17265 [Candidatus Omnitrophota bacterium]